MAGAGGKTGSYLALLCELYEDADGALVGLSVAESDPNAGLPPDQVFAALTYLRDHAFLEILATKPGKTLVKLTTLGIEFVETRLGSQVDAAAMECRLQDRARFLQCLYDEVEGDHTLRASSTVLSSRLDLPVNDVNLLARYWVEEGGVEIIGHKGDDRLLRITPEGVDEIEDLVAPVIPARAVQAGAAASSGTDSGEADTPHADNTFLKQADTWRVCHSGRAIVLGHTKGMLYLAFLLSHPNEDFLAADLFEAIEQERRDTASARPTMSAAEMAELQLEVSGPSDAGTAIDGRTRREVRQRISELKEQEEDVTQLGDTTALLPLREEREELEDYLAAATGLGGRLCTAADDYRRIRQRVYMNVKRAIRRLEKHHPELHTHLENSIKTTPLFAYRPDRSVTWHTD